MPFGSNLESAHPFITRMQHVHQSGAVYHICNILCYVLVVITAMITTCTCSLLFASTLH